MGRQSIRKRATTGAEYAPDARPNRTRRCRRQGCRGSRAATAGREAPAIPPEFRIGDCREALADIAAGSVALILTDPPYGEDAEPLYRWLAELSGAHLRPLLGGVGIFRMLALY